MGVTSATDDDATTDGEPVERSVKMQCESCQTIQSTATVIVTDFSTGIKAMLCNECEASLDRFELEFLDVQPIVEAYEQTPSELWLGQVA